MTINTMAVPAGRALAALRAGRLTASWMLHGRPGVGKSDIVRRLAAETGALLVDLRLTTIEPQDLRGLPYYDHAARKTRWYRPEDLPDDPDRPAVLFLDELTAAPPQLHPAVYGLLQERRVGPHRLPDSVFIVAAGNSAEDGAVAYEMGTALSDRLVHLLVEAEAGDWIAGFAVPQGLHPAVPAFLRTRPDLLETTQAALGEGLVVAATPRSWERASAILRAVPERGLARLMLAGTLGEAVAAEFLLVADDIAATVAVDALLEAPAGRRAALYPATLHGLNALVYGLVGALDAARAGAVIEALAAIRDLDRLRPGEGFGGLPLAELCTHGFELAIRKALEGGLAGAFLDHPAYAAYAAERQALGLDTP
jgi:hypothetical protein